MQQRPTGTSGANDGPEVPPEPSTPPTCVGESARAPDQAGARAACAPRERERVSARARTEEPATSVRVRERERERDERACAEGEPGLGTGGGSSLPPSELTGAQASRRRRSGLMATARAWSAMGHPVRVCGWEAAATQWDGMPAEVGVAVRTTPEGRRAAFTGLPRCGSVWACAECAQVVSARRTEEVARVLSWAHAEGHQIAMVTLTVQHRRDQPLADVWDAVSDGWGAITGGRWASETEDAHARRVAEWREAGAQYALGNGRAPRGWHQGTVPVRRVGQAEEHGVLGWVRAVEVTLGAAGWHVHTHALLVLRAGADPEALAEVMWQGWERGIGKRGFKASRRHGLDLRVAEGARRRLAEYLAKGVDGGEEQAIREALDKPGRALAREAAMGSLKTAKRGNRHPMQLLADLRRWDQIGRSDSAMAREDQALWLEWTTVSRRRRQFVWSHSLRALAGALSEEEIVLQAEPSESDVVVSFPASCWPQIRAEGHRLLEAAEHSDAAALAWLEARGIPYWTRPRAAPPERSGQPPQVAQRAGGVTGQGAA